MLEIFYPDHEAQNAYEIDYKVRRPPVRGRAVRHQGVVDIEEDAAQHGDLSFLP